MDFSDHIAYIESSVRFLKKKNEGIRINYSDKNPHNFEIIESIFWNKRIADELIILQSIKHQISIEGKFPTRPKFDSIGAVKNKITKPNIECPIAKRFDETHLPFGAFLFKLNDACNCIKHSIGSLSQTEIGVAIPLFVGEYYKNNNFEIDPQLIKISVDDSYRCLVKYMEMALGILK